MDKILESITKINEEVIKISKEDQTYGALLFNALVFVNNMYKDIAEGNGTDYIKAFKSLSGVDIMDVIKSNLDSNYEIEEEILEFIVGDNDDINIYKNKLKELKDSIK